MKKKIFMFTLVACLVILSIAGSSLAYFTDTDKATTTFTAGDVDITLTVTPTEATKIFPGVTYNNLATVTSAANSEDAFVGLTIDLTSENVANLQSIISLDGSNGTTAIANVIKLGTGYTAKYIAIDKGFRVFVVVADALIANPTNPAAVDVPFTVSIPAEWDFDDATIFTAATVTVTAYATQTEGFNAGAENALKTAFNTAGAWLNCPASN